MNQKTFLLMAGGTGGHIFPALAVAQSLKEQGLTIFLTSHFMDEVEALCDEICI